MSQDTRESILRTLVVTIVPLFFGSLLFAGILESFKNDVSSRKEMVNDLYRPMREIQADCQRTHNRLFAQYGELGGSFKVMLSEFNQIAVTDRAKMTGDYQILLNAIFSSNMKAQERTTQLEEELGLCRAKLFQKYSELALVTGTYDKFTSLSKARADAINRLYATRRSFTEKWATRLDPDAVMQAFRDLLQVRLETQEQKMAVVQKITAIANPLVEHYAQMGRNEEEMFQVDLKLFEDLHQVFADEISDRFRRGVIARLFF